MPIQVPIPPKIRIDNVMAIAILTVETIKPRKPVYEAFLEVNSFIFFPLSISQDVF